MIFISCKEDVLGKTLLLPRHAEIFRTRQRGGYKYVESGRMLSLKTTLTPYQCLKIHEKLGLKVNTVLNQEVLLSSLRSCTVTEKSLLNF